jgi:hypothetical protein
MLEPEYKRTAVEVASDSKKLNDEEGIGGWEIVREC